MQVLMVCIEIDKFWLFFLGNSVLVPKTVPADLRKIALFAYRANQYFQTAASRV